VVTLEARNANEAMVAPMLGSGGIYVWRESGVRRSVLCRYFWQESGFSRHEDVFTSVNFDGSFARLLIINPNTIS
jgi:hypothetical protein